MPKTATAKIQRFAVFLKTKRDGVDNFIRKPYDVVSYDYSDGLGPQTFLQPVAGRRSPMETEELYDGIRIYDTRPAWDIDTLS